MLETWPPLEPSHRVRQGSRYSAAGTRAPRQRTAVSTRLGGLGRGASVRPDTGTFLRRLVRRLATVDGPGTAPVRDAAIVPDGAHIRPFGIPPGCRHPHRPQQRRLGSHLLER